MFPLSCAHLHAHTGRETSSQNKNWNAHKCSFQKCFFAHISYTSFQIQMSSGKMLHKRKWIQLPQYADDMQLHIAQSHTDQSGELKLEECLSSMYAWLCFNGLAINPDKSEAVLFGLWQCLRVFPLLSSINLTGTAVPLSNTIKTLGVTLDSKLTFRPHIANLCKSCFYRIRGNMSHQIGSD